MAPMHDTFRLLFLPLEAEASLSAGCPERDGTDGPTRLQVVSKQQGEPVAKAWVCVRSEGERSAEIGFELENELVDQDFYAEVCLGLLQLAFGKLGVVSVSAKCAPSQESARRTFTRMGMALQESSSSECHYVVRAAEFLVQEICLT